jgi:type II secretory ATPase GspE/PulE/Tfp pilus assembly ATPase PilB-like protein
MDKKSTDTSQPRTLSTQAQSLRDFFSVASPDPIRFLDTVLTESVKMGASDILFEPTKDSLRIRARIDGVVYELGSVGLGVYGQISSRIKVMGNLDPIERREIQEGQFVIENEGRTVNLRVEIAQVIHGELIVIRVHEKSTIIMDLASLGFNRTSYTNYQNMLKQRSGLILVCGPTGCGKTTTLYSTITKLNENKDYNVMTIEDPIEYQLDGVNQMQVKKDEKFTFSEGLKTILRLSPDIVLVGEIRDKLTAEIAVESGLTGQLVLSTMHAEDSVGALFRLLDLGIETYLLNSSLMGIVAQRLVRRACPNCRKAYQPDQVEIELFERVMGRAPKQLTKGEGCTNCNNLAFKGRTGIFEVLVMDAHTRDLLRSKVNEDELREELIKGGFLTLLRDGLEKAEQGVTTVDEVLRNSLRVV